MDDWRRYKSLRNRTTARIKEERKTWEKEKLNSVKNNPTSLWKNVKTWLNWNNTGPPSQLFHQGQLINSPAGLAGTMNNFFISKVRNLRQGIPPTELDPLHVLREAFSDRECSFRFTAVHPEEVHRVLRGLKNTKSCGVDYIDTAIVKLVAEDILAPLTHVINLSIQSSTFPSMWKQAKVIPLLKKGDPHIPKTYRPVALLPILSKVLERVVYNQLVKYLDTEQIIHQNHHGSRQGHSTATALIQLYDRWVDDIDSGNMVGVMMVDLSAAFDMVDHPILLEKLRIFGLEESALQWMSSYLVGRSQSTYVDGCFSPALDIECGVPQGSILGPLLYILFTNDVPSLVQDQTSSFKDQVAFSDDSGGMVCYVDDGTYTVSHSDPNILLNVLTAKYLAIADDMVSNLHRLQFMYEFGSLNS